MLRFTFELIGVMRPFESSDSVTDSNSSTVHPRPSEAAAAPHSRALQPGQRADNAPHAACRSSRAAVQFAFAGTSKYSDGGRDLCRVCLQKSDNSDVLSIPGEVCPTF